ncbi:unnamed protein product [Thelazia callipaeda]|uniref:Phorbol-ester/DAG-type domain-containing protein n=1 Tax=Thelazia callipaeda TaxID=103827 RepID=A0A0N5CN80_THECL|nr:unnamed protein product [Thelazia callipaeda]
MFEWTEGNVLDSALKETEGNGIHNLNVDISAENRMKDSMRNPTRRGRLQARAVEMAAAGKARMSDFWYRHKDVGSCSRDSVGLLGQCNADFIDSSTSSPVSNLEQKKRSPLLTRKKISVQNNEIEEVQEVPNSPPKTLTTKALTLNEDILWGQSLHFKLDPDFCKYLNVIVQTRPSNREERNSTDNQIPVTHEDDFSQMLGYVSIYIPQLLDDCQLTLSNCHRELFMLRPPFCITRRRLTSKAAEESRRAGFDERLCYGDIVLGFRYFPEGFPTDVKDQLNTENAVEKSFMESNIEPSSSTTHSFKSIALKGWAICAVCKGKVWLKLASHCTRCFIIFHNKCLVKVDSACTPRPLIDDSTYEVSHCEEHPSTRRRRIAIKVSERISSTWKSVGRKKASFHALKEIQRKSNYHRFHSWKKHKSPVQIENCEIVPVEKAIPDVFSILRLSGNTRQMMYQPGNAYNEEMISAAKIAGKDMFSNLDPVERKAKINEDMEKIRSIIHQTTVERLSVMESERDAQSCDSVKFILLENRLQALAVLMLHYCAALQNCIDLEENCECQNEKIA